MIPKAPTTPPPSGVNESPRGSLSSEDASPRVKYRKSLPPTSEDLKEIQGSPGGGAPYRKSKSFTKAGFSSPKVYDTPNELIKTVDSNLRKTYDKADLPNSSPTNNDDDQSSNKPGKTPCDVSAFYAALTAGQKGRDKEDVETASNESSNQRKPRSKSNDEGSETSLPKLKVKFKDENEKNPLAERAMKQLQIENRRHEKEKAYEAELEKLERLREREVYVDLERENYLRESLVKLDAQQDPMLKLFQQSLVKDTRKKRSATLAVMKNSAQDKNSHGIPIPIYHRTGGQQTPLGDATKTDTTQEDGPVMRSRAMTWNAGRAKKEGESDEENENNDEVDDKDDSMEAEKARMLRLAKLDAGNVENDDADSEEDMAEMTRIMKMKL